MVETRAMVRLCQVGFPTAQQTVHSSYNAMEKMCHENAPQNKQLPYATVLVAFDSATG